MTGLVPDGSAALAWCFEDETTDETRRLFDRVERFGAVVPPIWAFEVANALLVGERRGRVVAGRTPLLIDVLRQLPIRIDPLADLSRISATLDLARREGLSVYDASYLELALRTGLPLATSDRAMARAAAACSVDLVTFEDSP